MPIERTRQSREHMRSITFDELLTQWHALQPGVAKDFIMADKNGMPIAKAHTKGAEPGSVILRLKAEPNYTLDDNPNAAPIGTRYTAYEYVTNLDDVELLDAYWDDEYFDRYADKERTYIPVVQFVQSHKSRKKPAAPILTEEPSVPVALSQEPPPHIRRAREITDTRREFRLRVAELLRADNEFSRRWHARFLRMQVIERFQQLESGQSEERFFDGMRLQQGRQSFRGGNVAGRVEDPDHVVATLVIQLVQRTQPLVGNATVTYLSKAQAEDLAALVAEVENLTGDTHTEFREELQAAHIEQVRVEVLSWRERAESKYPLTIPIAGNKVPFET